MNSKHICRRFTVTILVFALLPWSVFFYSGDAKASFHFFSDVSDETEAELEDLIISSDLILDEDLEVSSVALQDESTLDLNGHMLTVRGDFLHSDGTLKVNKGSLFVDGDYRMQKRRLEGENYVYDVAESKMIMQDAEDTDVNGKTVKYGYDEIGNILSITYPGGEIVRYSYNPDSSLESFVDGAGRKTSYTYDEQGRRETVTRPDGSVETTTYNDKNLVGSVEDRAKDGTLLQRTEYSYDGWGNITSIKETVKPDYDVDHTPEALGVGAEVKEDQSEEAEITSRMEYNDANQLIRFNDNEVRYDLDGNMIYGPLNGEMTEFSYDCRNRLISAGGETYRYDAENVRISVETEEYTETYVTDRVYALSRTLEIEKNYKNNTTGKESKPSVTTTCYYGTGLVYDAVNVSNSNSANNTDNSDHTGLRVYHFDHLGSTRYLTDQNGKATMYFNYGAYGEFLGCHDEKGAEVTLCALENPVRFLYNGELGVVTDENTLLYMRQRYYNPEIKRFINQDVLTGSITNGLSLNRYSYVEGNPISYTDPFGLSKMRDTLRGINNTYNVIKNSITHMSPHTVLDLLGTIPGIGSIFDLSNAALYALEGKKKEALESVIFAIPTMDVVGAGEKISKYFGKGGKYVKAIAKVVKLNGTAAAVGIAAHRTGEGIASLIDDYAGTGRSLDSEFWLRVAGIGVGTVQTTAYGRTLGRDVLQYTSLENKLQNIKQAIAKKLHELRNNNKGYVRLDVLLGKGGRDYYQDANGRWHRPNGQFASNAEMGIETPVKTSSGTHGNSLSDSRTNYGYALVDKDTNEILKFGETLYPDSRYSQNFLDKNNAKMIIMEQGSKSYIHDWQHDLNMYYKYKYGEFPPLNEGGW